MVGSFLVIDEFRNSTREVDLCMHIAYLVGMSIAQHACTD